LFNKKILLLIVFLLFSTSCGSGSLKPFIKHPDFQSQFKKIELKGSECIKQIIFENDFVKINVCYEAFQNNLKAFINKNNVPTDKELLAYIENEILESNQIYFINNRKWRDSRYRKNISSLDLNLNHRKRVSKLHKDIFGYSVEFYFRFHYRIADLLESGNIIIINKKNNKSLDRIYIEEYSMPNKYGGRTFRFKDGSVFFVTTDWES